MLSGLVLLSQKTSVRRENAHQGSSLPHLGSSACCSKAKQAELLNPIPRKRPECVCVCTRMGMPTVLCAPHTCPHILSSKDPGRQELFLPLQTKTVKDRRWLAEGLSAGPWQSLGEDPESLLCCQSTNLYKHNTQGEKLQKVKSRIIFFLKKQN